MGWFNDTFELQRGGGAGNVRPMEGLRGFAVFLVFFVHYTALVKPWIAGSPATLSLARGLHDIGGTGVDLFFVLSGYLIYGSLIAREQRFFKFMSRRVERIYPAFAAVFAVYLLLSFLFPQENKIPSPWPHGLLYVAQNLLLLPGIVPIDPMITVAWSLSYEMFYYLAIPLLIVLLGLRSRRIRWRLLIFLGLAWGFALLCAFTDGPIKLIMFIAGIILYEVMQSPLVLTPASGGSLAALVIGLSCMLLRTDGPAWLALKEWVLFVAFFLLCLTCFRAPEDWLPRAFAWTPLRWLGNMSYSYYLVHGLALKGSFLALSRALPPETVGAWVFWPLLPLMFAWTLLPSAGLFVLVERPLSLAPRRARIPRPAGASAPAAGRAR
ncbi:MAG TPA: acyltransferase [Verrucomicrobiae bacterium]|nr:acyltransferase [Verrucomicrobiae bacterium]